MIPSETPENIDSILPMENSPPQSITEFVSLYARDQESTNDFRRFLDTNLVPSPTV